MTASPPTAHDWPAFIRANTKQLSPPLVPEIALHLAEESLPIWQRTEEELGEMKVPPPFWAACTGKRKKLPRPTALPAMARTRPMRVPHSSFAGWTLTEGLLDRGRS